MSKLITQARYSGLALTLVLAATAMPTVASEQSLPRLVLQITVDQLRGDLPRRYYERLGEGGFRYLLDEGLVYINAHHAHANTETVVGHATLATGADPARHGMIGNVWFDRQEGTAVYGVEDSRYPLVGDGGVDKTTEIDPTQKTARSDGRSPAAILVSTFSDELNLNLGGRSKIFGVSVKDRGAITLAGHTGKAFWFSKKNGQFVTSQFYYDSYPQWVQDWNAKDLAADYAGTAWHLLNDQSTYLFGDADDRPYETNLAGYGRIFPHAFGNRDSRYFTTLLTLSPAGDEITLDFAKTLFENEQLGQDNDTDFLAVSFSSTDYVGHIFGPSSLESEDNILRLDRTLAQLFQFIDEKVGLEHTLIVLSADHGGPEAPGYLRELGFEASYISPQEVERVAAINALQARFQVGEELIRGYFHPYLYLNHELIESNGLDLAEVQAVIAEALTRFDGIAAAIPNIALREGDLPETPIVDAVLRNHHPDRSGDVYVVFDPHRFINDFDGLTVASTHGSPWQYDTYVPIIFAGMDIQPQRVARRVNTTAIAPTLSLLVGAKPPSGAWEPVLVEVFGNN